MTVEDARARASERVVSEPVAQELERCGQGVWARGKLD